MQWRRRRTAERSRDPGPLGGNPDEDFARGVALLEAGQRDAGIEVLTALAGSGHRQAAILASLQYLTRGQYDAAEPLLRDLAARGDAESMYLLGAISRGRDQDETAARRWFLGGASQANPACMFELGTAAAKDDDRLMAHYWLGRAATAGHTDAMVNLAGVLLGTDPEGASRWWQRATELGNKFATQNPQLAPGH